MNRLHTKIRNDQKGVVLVTVLIVGMLLTFVGLSLADVVISQYSTTSDNVYRANATLTAEAGIEQTLYSLNENNAFTGYTSEQEFVNNSDQGRATYQTQVTSGNGNEKILISTGRTYHTGSDELISERTVKVSLIGTASDGYSVYAGVGGLTLGGSASIRNTDIYVNGKITMTGASSIGTTAQPVNVKVANYACPTGVSPGATYPQLCTNTQPISIPDWSTVSIIGNVCATGQTQSKFPNSPYNNNQPQIRGGTGGQGLIAGCVADNVTIPTYDKAAQVSQVTTTASPTANAYNCSTWVSPNGFVRTWPANLKLTGNTSLSSSCDLTVTGNVYITGNLTIGGAATIRIADSLGTTRPVIIVDGTITAGGGSRIIANSSGTSAYLISFKSSATCSPDCTSLSGNNLRTSQDQQNVTVDGGGSYPGAIFHAYWSKIRVTGSGNIGSALGQTVDLSGAGNITFGTELSSGTTTWTIRSYQRIFD